MLRPLPPTQAPEFGCIRCCIRLELAATSFSNSFEQTAVSLAAWVEAVLWQLLWRPCKLAHRVRGYLTAAVSRASCDQTNVCNSAACTPPSYTMVCLGAAGILPSAKAQDTPSSSQRSQHASSKQRAPAGAPAHPVTQPPTTASSQTPSLQPDHLAVSSTEHGATAVKQRPWLKQQLRQQP